MNDNIIDLRNRIKKSISWASILSIFSSVCSVFALLLALGLFREKPTTREILLIGLIGIIILFQALVIIIEELRFSKSKKHAETLSLQHKIHHTIRDLYVNIKCNVIRGEQDVVTEVRGILDNLSAIFTLITGTPCRTCIKTIKTPNNLTQFPQQQKRNLYVVTKFRNSQVKESDCAHDEFQHYLTDNSDFEIIFKEPQQNNYFFSNDLIKLFYDGKYRNSSFHARKVFPKEGGWLQRWFGKSWPLPYRSSIVWPIRKITLTSDVRKTKQILEKQDVFGFLAVDSPSRGVFQERYDTELGASIADVLYILFDLINEKENANIMKSQEACKIE